MDGAMFVNDLSGAPYKMTTIAHNPNLKQFTVEFIMFIEIYKSKDGWRFRVKAGNNKIIAASESYWNKQDCIDTATLLKREMRDSTIRVLDEKPKEEMVIEVELDEGNGADDEYDEDGERHEGSHGY